MENERGMLRDIGGGIGKSNKKIFERILRSISVENNMYRQFTVSKDKHLKDRQVNRTNSGGGGWQKH